MDDGECTALAEALADVPDPRKRRGRRHPWGLLLTLISAALASGQRRGPAIGQGGGEHRDELAGQLRYFGRPRPGEGALRRAGGGGGAGAGRGGAGGRVGALAPAGPGRGAGGRWEGVEVDGKEVRGALAHGRGVRLVEAVRHVGVVLAETAVGRKGNEITAAPRPLLSAAADILLG